MQYEEKNDPKIDNKKIEAFNNFFCSVFSKLHHLEDAEIYPTSVFNKKIITEPGINNLLNHLHLSKAIDPDGLGNLTLKHLSPSPKMCLSLIFQTFINKIKYPYQWKISEVVPIFTDLDKIQINR